MNTNSTIIKNNPVNRRFDHLSPEQKLLLSMQLYHDARALKKAALKSLHPEWNDNQVNQTVKQIFSNARTWS